MTPAPRTVAVVQARLGSVRFPRKVLEELSGRSAIELLLERLGHATVLDEIVLAVPDGPADDDLGTLGERVGVRVVRGSEQDVLARYAEAVAVTGATVVVRITGDCPLIDPDVVDRVVRSMLDEGLDWAVTGTSMPDGLDVHAARASAILQVAATTSDPYDREHVFPGLRREPTLRGTVVEHERDLSAMRITLDEPEDLEVLRAITERLDPTALRVADLERLWDSEGVVFAANRHLVRDAGSRMGAGQKLWGRALRRIPGGSMLLSKRAEMFLPREWPAYFDRASGCEVWDLDGNRYIDAGLMGVGTNVLGYAHPKVDEAVTRVVQRGALATLNAPEEVALAERLCELHPWAEMARFTRSGGEACAVAVRIARAASGRDAVAFCGYHGWHDWYLAANLADDDALDGHLLPGLEPAGVPRVLRGTARPFPYNDLAALERLLATGEVGTIIMEVERSTPPAPGFLAGVRELATRHDAVLVFDECTSGFRQVLGGHHLVHGVEPDVAIFGKTLGNGFAINAVIGRTAVMEAATRTFISSTFWTERIGPAAALAALDAMEEEDANARVHATGADVRSRWRAIAARVGLDIQVSGLPALSGFALPGRDPGLVKAFIVREMLEAGFLAGPALYASVAHTPQVLDDYSGALEATMSALASLDDADLDSVLGGRRAWTGFERLA